MAPKKRQPPQKVTDHATAYSIQHTTYNIQYTDGYSFKDNNSILFTG